MRINQSRLQLLSICTVILAVASGAQAAPFQPKSQAGKEACDTLEFLNESVQGIPTYEDRFKAAENLAERAALDLVPEKEIDLAAKVATGAAVTGAVTELALLKGYAPKKALHVAAQHELALLRAKVASQAASGGSAGKTLLEDVAAAEAKVLAARTAVRRTLYFGALARWASKLSAGVALADLAIDLLQSAGDTHQKSYLTDPLHKGDVEPSTMTGFLSREPMRLLTYVPEEACRILDSSPQVRDRFNWEASLILSIGTKASLKPAAITAKQGKDVQVQMSPIDNGIKDVKASFAK